MSRPSSPELARRIVDRVLRTLEAREVFETWWFIENKEAAEIRRLLSSLVEKELEDR